MISVASWGGSTIDTRFSGLLGQPGQTNKQKYWAATQGPGTYSIASTRSPKSTDFVPRVTIAATIQFKFKGVA
jgi:hypothetical protein